MEQTLGYLRESLSNWVERDPTAQHLYQKIEQKSYHDNANFIEDLDEKERTYITEMLQYEMDYAKNEQDQVRYDALRSIFDLLD
ncbi:hypothetical protein [Caldalkalibacillus mannanilyticus]|uniref:hypothetical protein n=1 Tax=Caldalkalibacillus mannanilyticus TaxID=1418 RepID=UPI000469AA44|nr:hypothetical protein [Caldalkalibacillus mannanilyticus]